MQTPCVRVPNINARSPATGGNPVAVRAGGDRFAPAVRFDVKHILRLGDVPDAQGRAAAIAGQPRAVGAGRHADRMPHVAVFARQNAAFADVPQANDPGGAARR